MEIVDHHITRRPRDVGIAELDAALEWVSDCLGRPLQGRLIEYRRTLRQVLRRARENKIELLASELSETDFLNTVFEAETLIQVWKAFCSNPPTKIADKLKIIIKSVPFARDEGEETQARNAVFELQLGVLLVERGTAVQAVQFENPTDLSVDFNGYRFLIECKRVQTANAILGNIQKAESQLTKWISQDSTNQLRGIIAIDASKIFHLTFRGHPLFPRSVIGRSLLPSSFLVAENDRELVSESLKADFDRQDLTEVIGPNRQFETLRDCLAAYASRTR